MERFGSARVVLLVAAHGVWLVSWLRHTECAYYFGLRHTECAYYFGLRHTECAYYLGLRHTECAYYLRSVNPARSFVCGPVSRLVMYPLATQAVIPQAV